MEVSANVETDADSVLLTDKDNDNISEAIRIEDSVEESKTDVEVSFEMINNGDISDTDKNCTNESVSTSKDVISLDSIVSIDASEKLVEHSTSNNEEVETDQTANNDPENLLSVDVDDENLLDEIHSGDFNATSSPVSKSSGHLNTSVQSADDSFEMLENDALEEQVMEEQVEEQDIEEEEIDEHEEKDQTNEENNDDDTIVLDDDDDESDDDDDEDESGNDDDESLDGSDDISDKEENDRYDDNKDDDISTLSSEADDIEMTTKEPEEKPEFLSPSRKPLPKPKLAYKTLVKRSVKM